MRGDDDEDALELDDEDEDLGAVRRRRIQSLRGIRLIAWGVLFCVTAYIGLSFFSTLARANSAIQEAAAGAVYGGAALLCYILTRCLDEVLARLEQSYREDETSEGRS